MEDKTELELRIEALQAEIDLLNRKLDYMDEVYLREVIAVPTFQLTRNVNGELVPIGMPKFESDFLEVKVVNHLSLYEAAMKLKHASILNTVTDYIWEANKRNDSDLLLKIKQRLIELLGEQTKGETT